jgi:hypothetical protein
MVTVKANMVGTIENTVTVSSIEADANSEDNVDTETTEVTAGAAGGGGGSSSMSWFIGLSLLPIIFRRRVFKQSPDK